MTLGRKTVLILLFASLASVLLSYVVLQTTVYSTFIELENSGTANDLARVEAAIQAQLDSLVMLNSEYSQWDDTYAFLQDRNEAYVAKNITADLLDSLAIDSLIIFDKYGQYVAGVGRDAESPDGYRVNHRFDEFQTIGERFSVGNSATGRLVGVVSTSSAPLLIVSLPVLQNDASGPPVGSVMFARYLTESRIQQLRDQLTTEFDIIPANSDQLPLRLQGAVESLDTMPVALRQVRRNNDIATYAALPDIYGQPAFVVEVTTPREISAAGAQAVVIALVFLALTSILYLVISSLSLQKLIILPLAGLTGHIGQMRQSGKMARVPTSDRTDEFGTLTHQFNALIDELETARTVMVAARDDAAAARDAALEASKAKSQFLANMSHEIRTPINGVLGMTELLLSSTDLDERQRRYAETIAQSGNSLLSVINDILDFSKIEAGKLDLDFAPFDVRQTVEESLELMAEQADSKGLELLCDISPGLQTSVQGDANRLRQILINLIGNAVKFTDRGEIVVRMAEIPDGSEEAMVLRIEVQDTGIGIEPENQPQVFESFAQADGSNTRNFGGTGLGLSISKQLVELMGGQIGVESIPGQGSTFWFTARWPKDDGPATSLQPEWLAGVHVLVVDDNATNREILRRQLEHWHMTVAEASSGMHALAELQQASTGASPYDLVLLDFHMPEMDGLEVARNVQGNPALRHVPLVLLSSVSVSGDIDREETGLAAWLTKPVRQFALHNCLTSVCGGTLQSAKLEPDMPSSRLSDADGIGTRFRALLVEDNVVNQAVADGMLTELGGQITLANNGREAVDIFQAETFDLVLMDCQMPTMDGFEASQAIRQWEAEQDRAPTPIIALTANAFEGDRQRCLEVGMDDYLRKPFTLEQLRVVLATYLDRADAAPSTAAADPRQACFVTAAQASSHSSADKNAFDKKSNQTD
jgi:signal transduction histidine kinase/CheY-like chemotaxis protein